jgi:hypothetical protein
MNDMLVQPCRRTHDVPMMPVTKGLFASRARSMKAVVPPSDRLRISVCPKLLHVHVSSLTYSLFHLTHFISRNSTIPLQQLRVRTVLRSRGLPT